MKYLREYLFCPKAYIYHETVARLKSEEKMEINTSVYIGFWKNGCSLQLSQTGNDPWKTPSICYMVCDRDNCAQNVDGMHVIWNVQTKTQ